MTATRPHKLDDDGHSLDRFLERHYPDAQKPKRSDAETILNVIRATAVFVEHVKDEGQEIWRGAGAFHDVLMVVRDGVVCTVLKKDSVRPATRRRQR